MPGPVVHRVAWYDRDVAAALLAPRVRRIEKAADRELVGAARVLDVWALIDPRAAVAWLEKVPMTSTNPNDNFGVDLRRREARPGPRRALAKDFLDWAPIFNPATRDVMFDRF